MELYNLFDDRILRRGRNYYKWGKVKTFHLDDKKIFATVLGVEEYSVSIEFNNDDTIKNMECNCPYAQKGESCKHMAAVLYYNSFEKNGGEEIKK